MADYWLSEPPKEPCSSATWKKPSPGCRNSDWAGADLEGETPPSCKVAAILVRARPLSSGLPGRSPAARNCARSYKTAKVCGHHFRTGGPKAAQSHPKPPQSHILGIY